MMSRQNKAGAISALFFGLLVLVVLMVGVDARVSAVARRQSATTSPTPCDQEEQEDCDADATDAAADTQSAIDDMTASAGTSTSTSTATATSGAGTATVATTPALAPTNFTRPATPAPSPIVATPVVPAQQIEPTETPTAIPDDTLTCFPGQPLVISGEGPPRAAFLVYFGERVVSGGSIASSGDFATTLLIGRERPGVYPIVVRVRGTPQVLLELSCAVPDVTPTFVPRARLLP